MHKSTRTALSIILGSLFLAMVGQTLAQEDTYLLADADTFGRLRRSAVYFPHQSHVDTLGDARCGACHHAPDETDGRIRYVEGEETACADCHGARRADSVPALRQAFHRNCTGCHRQIIKRGDSASGPTTCGECHNPRTGHRSQSANP